MNTGSLYRSVIGIALCSLFFASPSKAETVWNGETFGDWRFECGSRAEGVTQCALVQSIIDTATNQTMVRLSFARSAIDGTVTASVLLPLGVELAENAKVHYGMEKMSLSYRICVLDGCLARRSVEPDELRRVANAQSLDVEFFAVGRSVPVEVRASGRGLSEAFVRLGYVAAE
jgi:invasion protein IalB